jgi:uncharacterized Zn-binding protein involved in type VI secretion
MPAVARLGDKCSGHGCFPGRANDSASSDVFVNSLGVHRVDDHWIDHTCKKKTHDGTLGTGSSTVFVNGKAVGRIGDDVSSINGDGDDICGSTIAQGSSDVFSG